MGIAAHITPSSMHSRDILEESEGRTHLVAPRCDEQDHLVSLRDGTQHATRPSFSHEAATNLMGNTTKTSRHLGLCLPETV